jgi:pyrroline-5-carboxylate reductase
LGSSTCISFSENNKSQAQAVISLFEDLGTAPVIDEKMDAAYCFGGERNFCLALH